VLLVARDALALTKSDEWFELASGWAAVSLVLFVVCFYQSIFMTQVPATLFAYFSGLVVSKLAALKMPASRQFALRAN
jgi:hypothetical protein